MVEKEMIEAKFNLEKRNDSIWFIKLSYAKEIVLLRPPALFVSCQHHLLSTDCLTGELRITFTLKAFLFLS